jgi:hypothetical protein
VAEPRTATLYRQHLAGAHQPPGVPRGFRVVSGEMGRSPIGGPASPDGAFDEGEQVYLGIAPEHCVLLEA